MPLRCTANPSFGGCLPSPGYILLRHYLVQHGFGLVLRALTLELSHSKKPSSASAPAFGNTSSFEQSYPQYYGAFKKDAARYRGLAATRPWRFEAVVSGDNHGFAALVNRRTGSNVASVAGIGLTPQLRSTSFADTATHFTDGDTFEVRVARLSLGVGYVCLLSGQRRVPLPGDVVPFDVVPALAGRSLAVHQPRGEPAGRRDGDRRVGHGSRRGGDPVPHPARVGGYGTISRMRAWSPTLTVRLCTLLAELKGVLARSGSI